MALTIIHLHVLIIDHKTVAWADHGRNRKQGGSSDIFWHLVIRCGSSVAIPHEGHMLSQVLVCMERKSVRRTNGNREYATTDEGQNSNVPELLWYSTKTSEHKSDVPPTFLVRLFMSHSISE